MGLLRDSATRQFLAPSVLTATRYLPSLNNAVWERTDLITDPPPILQNPLGSALQLAVRRSRISIEILKRPSDNTTKYDLFQRLNAGGIPANPQELRNCVIIMVNNAYSQFMRGLADIAEFRTVLAASDEQMEKQRHMEYVSRFLVYTSIPYDRNLDVEEYIDAGIVDLATQGEMNTSGARFQETFRLLNAAYGGNALRRMVNGQHTGRVGLAAFECIAIGVAKNIDHIRVKPDPTAYVRQRISEFWQEPQADQFSASGMRGTTRIQQTIPFGAQWFAT